MERMSGTDAVFLGVETSTFLAHVGGLCILDAPEGGFDLERMRENLLKVLPLVPKFTRVIKHVPLGLDLPVWEDDKHFDVDRHIRHVAIPSPGDKRQVGIMVGEIMGRALDRRYPLWELWVIEGLSGGKRIATFIKYHHALMDGKSGASLAELMFQLGPDDEVKQHESTEAPIGSAPHTIELLLRAPMRGVIGPINTLRYGSTMLRRSYSIIRHRQRGGRIAGLAPSTIFNGPVGEKRFVTFSSVALDDVKRIAKAEGCKVNDVVLALVTGAARNHMLEHGEVPEGPLTAAMGVSTATAASGLGNQVSSIITHLPTYLDDPVEQLRAVFDNTSHAKELLNAVRAHEIQSIGEVASPLLINLAASAFTRREVASRMPTPVSMLVSNVPGPPIPLWQSGARVRAIFASSILGMNMGLNVTLMSYDDRIDFGFTVAPEVVPEPQQLADRMPTALAALLKGLDLGKPTPVVDAWS